LDSQIACWNKSRRITMWFNRWISRWRMSHCTRPRNLTLSWSAPWMTSRPSLLTADSSCTSTRCIPQPSRTPSTNST
jgi:hypothetical protein